MIRKELKLVITFHTTADAMAMEKVCKENAAECRLIPVPRSITAGCGLAWCSRTESRGALMDLMQRNGIRHQGMQECMV